jgi:hypothetical protein
VSYKRYWVDEERGRVFCLVAQVSPVTYHVVDPTDLSIGRGPHPAANPFEKRVGEAIGITASGSTRSNYLPDKKPCFTATGTTTPKTPTPFFGATAG